MLKELKEKQNQYIRLQKELLELAKEKTSEIHERVKGRLEEEFGDETFSFIVPLTGGILADGWNPVVGFDRIKELDFVYYYHLSKEELIDSYPEHIDWEKLYHACDKLEKELDITINITKKR